MNQGDYENDQQSNASSILDQDQEKQYCFTIIVEGSNLLGGYLMYRMSLDPPIDSHQCEVINATMFYYSCLLMMDGAVILIWLFITGWVSICIGKWFRVKKLNEISNSLQYTTIIGLILTLTLSLYISILKKQCDLYVEDLIVYLFFVWQLCLVLMLQSN